MIAETLKERLQEEVRAELKAAGRDRKRLRSGLEKLAVRLGREADAESWADEYRVFILDQVWAGLAEVLDEAVAEEEYEWAAALLWFSNRELKQ